MAGIGFAVDGLKEFRDRLEKVQKAADDAARKAVTDGAHLIERRSKQTAPVLTGTLRRSIHVNSITQLGPGRWQSTTGPSVIYARFREKGGTIRPKNKPMLAWPGAGGTYIFAKSVTQKGSHYMQRAFDESIPAVRDIYRVAFKEALDI